MPVGCYSLPVLQLTVGVVWKQFQQSVLVIVKKLIDGKAHL